MQPVRITTAGASPVLPLRMVAAGTGATVGITLWVLGEGRYEPQNFPSFTIKAEDVAWSWATNSSNFAKVRETRNDSMGGNAWEVESSMVQDTSFVRSQVLWQAKNEDRTKNLPSPSFDSGVGTEADAGANEKTAEQLATEDLAVLFAFSSYGTFRATRMRSDLGRASLANDLRLIASGDQSQISNIRVLTKESDEPQCPYWDGCEQIGIAPRSVAAARNGSGGGCSNASAASSRTSSLVGGASMAIAAAALLGMGRLRRRRNR